MQTATHPTIKASELRIGNILLSPDTNRPVVIEINHLKYISDGLGFNGKMYDPIPLTPEILEKCFFGDDVPIYLWKDKNGYYLLSNESPLEKKPVYLHQLQNLYHSLTGEELEVLL